MRRATCGRYQQLLLDPAAFHAELAVTSARVPIVVDEVQRLPPLLNEVHRAIERDRRRVILLGSSARRLKTAGTNFEGWMLMTLSAHNQAATVYDDMAYWSPAQALLTDSSISARARCERRTGSRCGRSRDGSRRSPTTACGGNRRHVARRTSHVARGTTHLTIVLTTNQTFAGRSASRRMYQGNQYSP